jgi:hypothetical protein
MKKLVWVQSKNSCLMFIKIKFCVAHCFVSSYSVPRDKILRFYLLNQFNFRNAEGFFQNSAIFLQRVVIKYFMYRSS